jgi:predicted AAA+ superfamily ATPase
MPLKAYEDGNAFKLFLVDTGLMSALCEIDPKTLLEGNAIFSEFKGALTEQFVLQQLVCDKDNVICYWSAERSTAEVDFILQYRGVIVPIEVKAEENLQAKSLKVYQEKFSPQFCLRTSMSDFRMQEWIINLPLYAISELKSVI